MFPTRFARCGPDQEAIIKLIDLRKRDLGDNLGFDVMQNGFANRGTGYATYCLVPYVVNYSDSVF
jgi:hypothetical protein